MAKAELAEAAAKAKAKLGNWLRWQQ